MIDDTAFDRLRIANPVPDLDRISAHDLDAVAAAIARGRGEPAGDLVRLRAPRTWWVRPAIAFAAALLLVAAVIGVVSLASRDDGATRPPATMPTIAAGPTQRAWSEVLATRQAMEAPPTASCVLEPIPGPTEQDGPSSGWTGSLSGAFDTHRGVIIYVDSWRDTWAFDVCNNTWSELQPEGDPGENPSGGLVYDVDSDVTIAMGHEIAIYDPSRNQWTYPDAGSPTGPGDPFGGVYDPVSGLVIATVYPEGGGPGARIEAWAYDVDENAWWYLGVVAAEGEDRPWQYDLIGFSPELDRLIFIPSEIEPLGHTLLIDPRSGEREMVWTPTPTVSLRWPRAHYGVGAGTAFVAGVGEDGATPPDGPGELICGFDAATSSWSRCFAAPDRPVFGAFTWFGAMVGDPINARLVLIAGVYGEFGAMATSHVWAIDYATGKVVELVPDSP
ncbi:MAG: hypothetical protein QNJ81_14635 [Acidimicrobiia bacterium]|nr:hypothetical protein [Acidimicrobiia bacterium]